MSDLIFLLQAELDIQTIFNRQEDFQEGRGEVFLNHLDLALTLLLNIRKSAQSTSLHIDGF